jgi:putative transposase
MKLNKRKIHWIIRQKPKGVPTKQIALDMKISRRRVQQLWKGYETPGEKPAIGENVGRPKKLFDKREAQIMRIRRKRIGANGFDTNGSTVFQQDISTGMNRVGLISRSALS